MVEIVMKRILGDVGGFVGDWSDNERARLALYTRAVASLSQGVLTPSRKKNGLVDVSCMHQQLQHTTRRCVQIWPGI
jgi:hypothetical protein